jgi:hypothetical protein
LTTPLVRRANYRSGGSLGHFNFEDFNETESIHTGEFKKAKKNTKNYKKVF